LGLPQLVSLQPVQLQVLLALCQALGQFVQQGLQLGLENHGLPGGRLEQQRQPPKGPLRQQLWPLFAHQCLLPFPVLFVLLHLRQRHLQPVWQVDLQAFDQPRV
jgi:hypothetical protein